MRLFQFLILLFLFGCPNKKETISILNKNQNVSYNSQLTISNQDSLSLKYSRREQLFLEYFDSTHSFCVLDNDTLKFFLMTGWFEGSYALNLKVLEDSVHSELKLRDNHNCFIYDSSKTNLILNSPAFKVGDYVTTKISFQTIVKSVEHPKFRDTVIVAGKLKLRVYDSTFNFDSLYVKEQRDKFYSLLKERPDTITKLNLYGCSFTELPLELGYFKNLEKLELDGNDLSIANLNKLADLRNLRELSLQNCNLSVFPESVLRLRNLEILSVYNNHLKSIPDGLYNLANLKELTIGNNPLKNLSPKISNLKNLVSIETSFTNIKRYPDEIIKLKKLKEIYPSDTMLYMPKQLIKYVWGCDTILNNKPMP
jgi:Leucine-rich repeat (LRR) protein